MQFFILASRGIKVLKSFDRLVHLLTVQEHNRKTNMPGGEGLNRENKCEKQAAVP